MTADSLGAGSPLELSGTAPRLSLNQTNVYRSGWQPNLLSNLRTLWEHRDLVWALAERDVRIRYKQTILGVSWAILQPLSLTVIFTIIFSLFLHIRSGGTSYPVFAYVAMLPWTFFANSVSLGSASLVTNSKLLKKVYFPREVFPLAAVMASLFDLLMGGTILIGMLIYYRIPITPWLLFAPVILLIQLVFTGTLAMALSAVMVFFRDVRFGVPLLLQVWLYAVPVIYPVASVPSKYLHIYGLDPMVGIIAGYRDTVLYGRAPYWSLTLTAAVISAVLLPIGYALFKWAELQFADVV